MSRIEPRVEGGPAPSTKTDPPPPPGTEVPGVREGPTRGTSASAHATAGSTFEDDCEEPTSPATLGAPKAPAIAERGDATRQESFRHRQKFLHKRQGRKNLGSPGIDGHTEVVCSLRGDEI